MKQVLRNREVGMVKHDCYSFQQLWDGLSLNEKFAGMRGHRSRPVSSTPFWRRPSAPPPRVFVDYKVSTASEQVHTAWCDLEEIFNPFETLVLRFDHGMTSVMPVCNVYVRGGHDEFRVYIFKCSKFSLTIVSTLHNSTKNYSTPKRGPGAWAVCCKI